MMQQTNDFSPDKQKAAVYNGLKTCVGYGKKKNWLLTSIIEHQIK